MPWSRAAAAASGATICQELAQAGYRVVVSDVDAGRARRVADELGAPHDARAFDVGDEASVMAAFDDIETRHGPISVLVSAAIAAVPDNGERPLIRTPRWISGNAASP